MPAVTEEAILVRRGVKARHELVVELVVGHHGIDHEIRGETDQVDVGLVVRDPLGDEGGALGGILDRRDLVTSCSGVKSKSIQGNVFIGATGSSERKQHSRVE